MAAGPTEKLAADCTSDRGRRGDRGSRSDCIANVRADSVGDAVGTELAAVPMWTAVRVLAWFGWLWVSHSAPYTAMDTSPPISTNQLLFGE